MQTTLYAILHFLTDGLSAFALFARFSGGANFLRDLLLYNFAAFALQLLFGVLLDIDRKRQNRRWLRAANDPCLMAMLGLLTAVIGAFTSPIILGAGNALFHVGGGVDTILTDRERHLKGRALGVFVAPGALGLFLGKSLANVLPEAGIIPVILGTAAVFAVLSFFLFRLVRKKAAFAESKEALEARNALSPAEQEFRYGPEAALTARGVVAVILCFIVVILRSYAGLAIGFTWMDGFGMALGATIAVVLGKVAGGFLAARTSFTLAILLSLAPAAFLYWFKDVQVFGLGALFLFNMTMPITLYMIANRLREHPGFSFGLLSFGLFLGYLPVYFGQPLLIEEAYLGTVVSILSFLALIVALVLLMKEKGTLQSSFEVLPEPADNDPASQDIETQESTPHEEEPQGPASQKPGAE